MMGASLGKQAGMSLDTSRYLYKVCIKPSMTAGLQAIDITNESLKMLENYEESMMRAIKIMRMKRARKKKQRTVMKRPKRKSKCRRGPSLVSLKSLHAQLHNRFF